MEEEEEEEEVGRPSLLGGTMIQSLSLLSRPTENMLEYSCFRLGPFVQRQRKNRRSVGRGRSKNVHGQNKSSLEIRMGRRNEMGSELKFTRCDANL